MLTILFSLIVLNFLGPLSGIQDGGSFICELSDAPTQCGAFCMSALQPLIDDSNKRQIKLDRIEEEVGSLKKTISREEFYERLKVSDDQLAAVISEIKSALQVVHAKMENLETKNAALLQFFETKTKKMEAEVKDLQNKTKTNEHLALNQQSTTQKTPFETHSTTHNQKIIPPKFELIGTRYFYIERVIMKTWDDAAETCRRMGGYLAAFKTQEELAAILPKLNGLLWIGIKRSKEDGKLISTASGKPASVFMWDHGEPNYNGDCVFLSRWGMIDSDCSPIGFFICQLDNET